MSSPRDEFYVGYLPMPAGHLRFVRIAIPVLLWILVICSLLIAYSQRSPGDAEWDQGKPIQRTGTLHEKPYPHLILESPDAAPVFLVEEGKHGSAPRCTGLDGKLIRATGYRLDRDNREILELVPDPNAIEPLPGSPPTPPLDRDTGQKTLTGEVVDYKCYLGAMKPGDGKTHKACAALCITGGIPSMLITSDEKGAHRYILLAYEDGGPMPKWISELAGEPVRVSGHLHQRGPLQLLYVSSISRTSP